MLADARPAALLAAASYVVVLGDDHISTDDAQSPLVALRCRPRAHACIAAGASWWYCTDGVEEPFFRDCFGNAGKLVTWISMIAQLIKDKQISCGAPYQDQSQISSD